MTASQPTDKPRLPKRKRRTVFELDRIESEMLRHALNSPNVQTTCEWILRLAAHSSRVGNDVPAPVVVLAVERMASTLIEEPPPEAFRRKAPYTLDPDLAEKLGIEPDGEYIPMHTGSNMLEGILKWCSNTKNNNGPGDRDTAETFRSCICWTHEIGIPHFTIQEDPVGSVMAGAVMDCLRRRGRRCLGALQCVMGIGVGTPITQQQATEELVAAFGEGAREGGENQIFGAWDTENITMFYSSTLNAVRDCIDEVATQTPQTTAPDMTTKTTTQVGGQGRLKNGNPASH